jgi:hypothetical protein
MFGNKARSETMTPTILENHITHNSGETKSVCATAVLTAIGVPVDGFKYTGCVADGRRTAILNRHGFTCRSRMSKIGKNATIGQARKKISKLDDSSSTRYMVSIACGGQTHLMLLDKNGETLVDTDPRRADRRRVFAIYAVNKK